MRKIFTSIALVAAVIASVSCNKDTIIESNSDEMTFYGDIEDASTKTVITTDRKVNWEAGDKVAINGVEFTATPKADPTKAVFTLVSGKKPHSPYAAIYPASYHNEGKWAIPATIKYTGKFDNIPMAAMGLSKTLSFKNIFGVLKVSVSSDVTVKSIKVSSDCVMNGAFIIPDLHTAVMTKVKDIVDADKVVTVDCGAGVAGTDFYIAVPAGNYKGKNLMVTVIDTKNNVQTMTTDQTAKVIIAPNTIYAFNFKNEDLSTYGTANCYIVSEAGTYKFKAVKGNTTESLGEVKSVKVLWESFGTNVAPKAGDIIKANVSYSADDNRITFSTNDVFTKGNALIAACDANGKILWSWHIWCTDKPAEQVYNNNAGTMMDRSLGATSTTPGDVNALGLLYQWGRKDPFLGAESISSNKQAASTLEKWPDAVSYKDNFAYAVENPTTFIKGNKTATSGDWYDAGRYSVDNTRWQTSNKAKGLYDPCPYGWRVPNGDDNGVFAKASGKTYQWTSRSEWDYTNMGINFGANKYPLGTGNIWYPANGGFTYKGEMESVGTGGYYWTCSTSGAYAYEFSLETGSNFHGKYSVVDPADDTEYRAAAQAVRCVKEK